MVYVMYSAVKEAQALNREVCLIEAIGMEYFSLKSSEWGFQS